MQRAKTLLTIATLLLGLSQTACAQRGFGDGGRGDFGGDGGEFGGRGFSPGGFGGGDFGGRGGGFDPSEFLGRMDQNEDGYLDGDELENSRGPIRYMLESQGIDIARGVSLRDAEKMMKKAAEDRMRGGSSRDDRDRSRGDSRGTKPPEKIRVTVDLPGEYASGDVNLDGQISFAEWMAWKGRSAMGQFDLHDHNLDGFLTPKELTLGAKDAGTQIASAAGSTSGSTSAAAPARPAIPPVNLETVSVTGPDVEPHVKQAERYFLILDKDRNGSLTEQEWQRSTSIRAKFEQAGANFAQPMPKEDFVKYYVHITLNTSTS